MSKSKPKTMNIFSRIDTGISREIMQKITNILNDNLAAEYVLLTKTKNYHWNVEDPRFNDLHKFFEEQYELLATAVDEITERVRAVGGRSSYIKRVYKFFANKGRCRIVS
jgi:starvation-inducible DNA-binding protein